MMEMKMEGVLQCFMREHNLSFQLHGVPSGGAPAPADLASLGLCRAFITMRIEVWSNITPAKTEWMASASVWHNAGFFIEPHLLLGFGSEDDASSFRAIYLEPIQQMLD